jgi:uncharacterized protein (DUF433 family)
MYSINCSLSNELCNARVWTIIDECAKKGDDEKSILKYYLVNAKYIAAAIELKSSVIVCGL